MIIDDSLIEIKLEVKNKEEAINKMCKMAYDAGRLSGLEDYMHKVHGREEQVSTDMGYGIAIPHGKSKDILEPFVLFAKLENKILWNEEEGSYIDLIFMIGVPEENEDNVHLKLISQLAAKLMDDDFINNLRQVTEKKEVLSYLKEITI